jgi:HK97 gp10 family phage protein
VKVQVEVQGLKELDAALAQLPRSIQRSTLMRVLKKAGQPIADTARALAPERSGKLKKSIVVSARLKNSVGKSEFSAALRAGLGVGAARQALRAARRAAPGKSFAEMYVGTAAGTGVVRYAHIVEFGSSKLPPNPFMRPAFDAESSMALVIIRRELGNEIMASARRIGRSKRYSAEVKFSASMAAMMAAEVGD